MNKSLILKLELDNISNAKEFAQSISEMIKNHFGDKSISSLNCDCQFSHCTIYLFHHTYILSEFMGISYMPNYENIYVNDYYPNKNPAFNS